MDEAEVAPDDKENPSRQLPSADLRKSSPDGTHRECRSPSAKNSATARPGPLMERRLPSERPNEPMEPTVSAIPPPPMPTHEVCRLEKENRALEREVGELKEKHQKEVGALKQKLEQMEKAFEAHIRESTTSSSIAADISDQAVKHSLIATPRDIEAAKPDLSASPRDIEAGVPVAQPTHGAQTQQGEARRPLSQPPPRSSPPAFSMRSNEAAPARAASQQPSSGTIRGAGHATEQPPPSPQTKPPPGTWSSGEFERGLVLPKTAPSEVIEHVKNVVVEWIQGAGSSCCTPPMSTSTLGPPACGTPRNSLGEVRIDQIASPQRRTPRGVTVKAPGRQTSRGTPRGTLGAHNRVAQVKGIPCERQEASIGFLREKPKAVIMKQAGHTALRSSNPQGGEASGTLDSSIVERESCNMHDAWLEPAGPEDHVLDDLSKILQAESPEPKATMGPSSMGNSMDESLMGNSVDESFHGQEMGVPDLPQPKLGDISPANGDTSRPVLFALPVGFTGDDVVTPPRGTVFFPAPPTNASARIYHKGHHQSWQQRSRSNSYNRHVARPSESAGPIHQELSSI